MKGRIVWSLAVLAMGLSGSGMEAQEEPWRVPFVSHDLANADPGSSFWKQVVAHKVTLMAQPMTRPRPKTTATPELMVKFAHDGKQLAMLLEWLDSAPNAGGRPGQYSDAVAVQFPLRAAEEPPPIFMGTRQQPVHILHWRYQYQLDAEKGKPTMHQLYPNMSIDMYPLELSDPGSADPEVGAREQYSPGRAVGNPQAFVKTGVDEIVAEGFSTSSVQESRAWGRAVWRDGRWQVVLIRPLGRESLSELVPGVKSFVAFAVWEGGQHEVGARKSVTMTWSPIELSTPPKVAAQ